MTRTEGSEFAKKLDAICEGHTALEVFGVCIAGMLFVADQLGMTDLEIQRTVVELRQKEREFKAQREGEV